DTETQRRTSNAETAKPAEKRAKFATMSRCDRVHGFCHGDTETQRRTSNAETAKPAEKRAKFATMSRCDRVHGFCHGDTETRGSGAHAASRRTRRTQAGAAGLLSGQTTDGNANRSHLVFAFPPVRMPGPPRCGVVRRVASSVSRCLWPESSSCVFVTFAPSW